MWLVSVRDSGSSGCVVVMEWSSRCWRRIGVAIDGNATSARVRLLRSLCRLAPDRRGRAQARLVSFTSDARRCCDRYVVAGNRASGRTRSCSKQDGAIVLPRGRDRWARVGWVGEPAHQRGTVGAESVKRVISSVSARRWCADRGWWVGVPGGLVNHRGPRRSSGPTVFVSLHLTAQDIVFKAVAPRRGSWSGGSPASGWTNRRRNEQAVSTSIGCSPGRAVHCGDGWADGGHCCGDHRADRGPGRRSSGCARLRGSKAIRAPRRLIVGGSMSKPLIVAHRGGSAIGSRSWSDWVAVPRRNSARLGYSATRRHRAWWSSAGSRPGCGRALTTPAAGVLVSDAEIRMMI